MRFETVIEQYHDEIYRYLWRMLPTRHREDAIEAEDLTQETFMRAYRAYGRLKPEARIQAVSLKF